MKRSLNRWLTLTFAVILIVTLVISAVWNYYSTRQAILDREETSARNCASIVSSVLDHYGLETLLNPKDENIYRHVRNSIRSFCRGFSQNSLIIVTVHPETRTGAVVLAVAADDELDEILKNDMEEKTDWSDTETEIVREIQSGSDQVKRYVFGNEVLWYVPYRNEQITDYVVICMEGDISLEFRLIMRDFLMDILLPVAALTIAFLVFMILVKRRVTRPIRILSDSMNRFAQDSRHKPEPLNFRSCDEIGEIAESFEKMTSDISTYVNSIEELTRDRVQNNFQLEVSRRIQNGLVPEQCELEGDGFRVKAATRPATAVGGDFYDCFRLGDHSVCVFIGDVSGKGISAAIFMAMAKTIIREKLLAGLSPADALNETNDELYTHNPEGLFATVFAAILDTKTGELRYANAGHTFPVLIREKAEYLIPDSGIALGLFDDSGIRNECLNLSSGEAILLYTDGVTDAVNPQNEFFGMNRLLYTVGDLAQEENSGEDAVARVCREVGKFCGESDPFDDMALLLLAKCENRTDPDGRTLPVHLSSFDQIKYDVFQAAGDTPETRRALLACDEALANIVRYSGAKTLSFSCEKQGDELRTIFKDDGIRFDPTAEKPGEKEFEALDSGGMGLNVIRQSVSSIRYDRIDEWNVLTMCFRLEP